MSIAMPTQPISFDSPPPRRNKPTQSFDSPPARKKQTSNGFDSPEPRNRNSKNGKPATVSTATPMKPKVWYNMEVSSRKKCIGERSPIISDFMIGAEMEEAHQVKEEYQEDYERPTRLDIDYDFVKYLGQGNFSTVGLYRLKLTGTLYAIKVTSQNRMSINQIQALATLTELAQHNNHLVRYHHSWVETGSIYIVMEYCKTNVQAIYQETRLGDTPVDMMGQHQVGVMPEAKLGMILYQALTGLKAMHAYHMVHLDIKPANLLLTEAGIVKIADLGLCKLTKIRRWVQLDEGDSRYLAKQILNYCQGIDLTKADIYSLGLSISQGMMLQHQLPNRGDNWLSIRQNGINLSSALNKGYTEEFCHIVAWMTHSDWRLRPSTQELLAHNYFDKFSDKKKRGFRHFGGVAMHR